MRSTSEAKHMSVRYKAGKQRSKNMANFTASEWRWDQERQTVKERERERGERRRGRGYWQTRSSSDTFIAFANTQRECASHFYCCSLCCRAKCFVVEAQADYSTLYISIYLCLSGCLSGCLSVCLSWRLCLAVLPAACRQT